MNIFCIALIVNGVMDNVSCTALFVQCVVIVMLIAIGLLILFYIFKKLYDFLLTYHRSPRIPFNYYLSMIAGTILIGIFLPRSTASINSKCQNLIAFISIIAITIFHFYLACNSHKKDKKEGEKENKEDKKEDEKEHKENKKEDEKKNKNVINSYLFVISISAILLLIYTQISNSGSNSIGSSGSDLAICAAIIAAFATIYNVQRVSKQELTKNRQDWITNVRLETAKIISTFDFLKDAVPNGTKQDEIISNCKSLLKSCTKLRMFLNPGDTIAPMITAQVDAIINYCNYCLDGHHPSWVCISTNKPPEDSIIESINQVNLHKSLMPWVLVLLKAEWERVKDVLESREQTSDGFYSEDVYTDEWGINKCSDCSDKSIIKYRIDKLKKYGLDIETICNKNIIVDPFLGFKFCDKDEEKINEQLEKLGLVWENE